MQGLRAASYGLSLIVSRQRNPGVVSTQYQLRMRSNSTLKCRVAFGGIEGGLPASP